MTTYSLYSGSGPALVSYSGPFQSGIQFKVTEGGCYFKGWRWWVPAAGDTSAQKFALWNVVTASTTANYLIASKTSGTLTANSWNEIDLATPVPLAIGGNYEAATGWTAVAGFPDTNNQFNSGGPFSAGITNGPLHAFSDSTNGGTGPGSIGPQGQFGDTTGQTDPTAFLPMASSSSANFGMDVVVQDTTPAGTTTYRVWPNFPNPQTFYGSGVDLNAAYILGLKEQLSQACILENLWFFSPSGATQLPTQCCIWNDTTQTMVPGSLNTSPSWSGAAGSGWVSCAYGSLVLPAGNYITSVWNQAASGTGTGWNLYTSQYFGTGDGGNGITTGPITVPNAASSTPGQCVYQTSTSTFLYPNQYVSTGTPGQSYWLEAEVKPVVQAPAQLVAAVPPWALVRSTVY